MTQVLGGLAVWSDTGWSPQLLAGQPLADLCREYRRLVVHGHDRDESGYFVENGNQVCPVIFGAPRQSKRFLVLDLAGRYEGPGGLREGVEIRRVHEG